MGYETQIPEKMIHESEINEFNGHSIMTIAKN